MASSPFDGRQHCSNCGCRFLRVCFKIPRTAATSTGLLTLIPRKVWDTHTGECLHTLQHSHICRAVAFPIQSSPQILATGGFEKKLRIFDLTRSGGSNSSSPTSPSAGENGNGASAVTSYEIGPGVHGGTIKSIVWNQDYNILTTAAEDRKIRWWDLRSRHPVVEYAVEGTIGSCELNTLATRPNDPGILTVAAGKSVYLFDGVTPGRLLKKMDFRYEVASAAVNNDTGRLVTGSADDTWARVYDLRTEEELGMCIGTFHLLRRMATLTCYLRGPKGSPRPHLVSQFLSRRQALRHRK
jgi:serine-threonine kinase receptor-associated protein